MADKFNTQQLLGKVCEWMFAARRRKRHAGGVCSPMLGLGFSGPAAAGVLEPEPPDHPEGFDDDVAGELGGAFDAVGKGDGDFGHAESFAPEAVGHFDLEAVAIGFHGIEGNGLERAAAEAFVAARGVGEGHAGDEPDIDAGAAAEEQSLQWPVQYADAAGVAGSEDEVGVLRGFQEIRNFIGIVREVAVHLEDKFVVPFQGPFEAGDVGASEPAFLLFVDDVDFRVFGGEVVGNLAGAVGGVAVDDQDVHGHWQRQ